MAESDEDKVLLEDDSMDEMYELGEDLTTSIDTNASPTKPSSLNTNHRNRDDEEDKRSDSDESAVFNDGSSSDESESSRGQKPVRAIVNTEPLREPRFQEVDEREDDEPPEIPGSPLRTDTNGSGTARSYHRQDAPSIDILTIQHDHHDSDDDEDDYETKEAEAPRAMEFHTSSSSDSEAEETDSDESDDDHSRGRTNGALTRNQHTQHERPKTAAKELALYRGVVPSEYFEEILQDAPTSPKKQAQTTTIGDVSTKREQKGTRISAKYKLRVPQEIEDLFQYVDAYKTEVLDIPTRLQPFIPEYVPAVGLPFDGIQIPRPDNKPDAAGVAIVREPSAQSNMAELELLLVARTKNKRRGRHAKSVERVHSIEDATNRPRKIDQWITSVAKVQASRPQPQVLYKKPMPSETTLMELWPEELEVFLSTHSPLPISQMNLDLHETIRVVCGVLDIPVYEGLYIHSLHALFSLYHEVLSYEKEILEKTSDSQR